MPTVDEIIADWNESRTFGFINLPEAVDVLIAEIERLRQQLKAEKRRSGEQTADLRNRLQRVADCDTQLIELLSTGHTLTELIERAYEDIKDDERFELTAKHEEPDPEDPAYWQGGPEDQPDE